MDLKAPSTNQRVYEDFQPIANWVTEEAKRLEIHLPGFSKEQVKVQLDNLGNLKISGERSLEGNKWSRFRLNFRIPRDCNFSEIHAKFINNVLEVVIPKKIVRTSGLAKPAQEQESPTNQKVGNATKPEEQISTGLKDNKVKSDTNGEDKAKARTESRRWSTGSYEFGMGGYVVRVTKPRRVLVNVAVAIMMVVAAGGYAVYRLRSSSGEGAGGGSY